MSRASEPKYYFGVLNCDFSGLHSVKAGRVKGRNDTERAKADGVDVKEMVHLRHQVCVESCWQLTVATSV